MILYIFIAAITIFLAGLVRTSEYVSTAADLDEALPGKRDKRLLLGYTTRQRAVNAVSIAAIFFILSGLAALRLEVGNDYGTYVVTCHEIFQRGYVVTEPGYNLVVRILYTLSGKEDYLLMFAVFGAAIVAIFLKILKDQSDSFALAFFVFMTMGLYYRSFNTVRYYFALAIAVYCLRYLIDINGENLFKFFVLIFLAATFHKSVLICIPMFFLARIPWKKWGLILLVAAGLIVGFLHDQIMAIALKLYPSYNNTVYIEETHTITENAAPILGCVFVLVICIICYKEGIKDRTDNRMYYNMNIMAIVLYLSCYWMPLVTRFAYYLTTAQILLLPNLICSIRDEHKKKKVMIAAAVFYVLYFLYFLMRADNIGVRVLPYKSWLFYDHRWLNQTDTF